MRLGKRLGRTVVCFVVLERKVVFGELIRGHRIVGLFRARSKCFSCPPNEGKGDEEHAERPEHLELHVAVLEEPGGEPVVLNLVDVLHR